MEAVTPKKHKKDCCAWSDPQEEEKEREEEGRRGRKKEGRKRKRKHESHVALFPIRSGQDFFGKSTQTSIESAPDRDKRGRKHR